jgi:hypothetical protein
MSKPQKPVVKPLPQRKPASAPKLQRAVRQFVKTQEGPLPKK